MSNPLAIYEQLSPLYNSSKADIVNLAKKQAEYIIETGSSEKAFAFLKKISELVETVVNGIKEDAINEVRKGNTTAHGVTMSIKGKTTYNYENDAVWVELKTKIKQREDFLKAINYFIDEVDEETGEVTRIYQAGKKVSDYIESKY
jgi:hypothetical protein